MRPAAGGAAVVTGGGSGIGRALALRFGAAGMPVVVADVDAAAADAVAGELHEACAVVVDVRSQASVDEMVATTIERVGVPALVCANAGVGSRGLPAAELPMDDFDWVLDVNLRGAIATVQGFLPHLLRAGAGHIVVTSSVAGLAAMPGMAPYSAAKAGLIAYCEALRAELVGSGVGVSVLCPSWVRTSLPDWDRHEGYAATWTPTQADALRARRATIEELFATQAIEPEAVADVVVEALARDAFWIFTAEDALAEAAERLEQMRRDLRAATPPRAVDQRAT